MSRSRDGTSIVDTSARAGGALSTVTLPNIPRTTDEKSKIKYMTDYDKYEPELRKHHLGGPEASTTIGLKDVPVEFSRAIPSLSEPTAAEREYERSLQLRAKQRSRNRFYAPPKSTKTGGHSSGDGGYYVAPPAPAPPTATAAVVKAEDAVNPTTAADGSAVVAAAEAAERHEGAAATGVMAKGKARASTAPATAAGKQSAASQTSAPATTAGKRPVAVTMTEPPEPPQAKKPRRVEVSTSTTVAATAPEKTTSTAQRTSPATTRAAPSLQKPMTTAHEKPSTRPAGKGKVRGGAPSAAARSSPSPPPPAALTRQSPRPQRRPLDVEKILQDGAMQRTFPFAGRTTSPADGEEPSPPPSADVAECASVLRVLVDTPEEFMSSFKIDTDFFDLRWMRGDGQKPMGLTTLQNANVAHSSGKGATRHAERITSPRSVLVMLRNGVALDDLRPGAEQTAGRLPGASGAMSDPSQLLPEDPELRSVVKRYRAERDAARREHLLAAVQSEYLSLCQQVPLQELVSAFQSAISQNGESQRRAAAGAELPTSVVQRMERQQKMFATNKVRLQRQVELMHEVQEREEAAEARKAQAEAEAKAAAERKAHEEAEARARQQERLEAQRRKNAAMEEAYQAQLAERLAKAEARNQERLEAQARLAEQRQQQRAAIAAERRERFERNAQLQEVQASELEARRREKEARLEQLAHERETRLAEVRREMEERHARATEAREAARARAEQAQAAVQEAALAKQREVEGRLEEYQRRRAEEHALRLQEEELKEQRRLEALSSAQQQQRAFQERTKERAEAQEAALQELQRERAMERTIRIEHEREEAAQKRYAVQQKQRVEEFAKLKTIARLLEKRAAADFVTKERDEILRQSLKVRDALDAEKERLRRELEEAKRTANK